MTKSLPASQSKASSAPALKRPIPAASVARAKKAFRNFSLSRFAGSGTPSNYVAAGQNPAEVQRKKITQHLENVSKADRAGQGMTIALPDAMIKKLLPSFNAKAGTIDLGEVITLVQQNMRGTEFYSNGHPTLNRLAIQSQVQQIINSVKKGGQK
jgi:hypothetical protein